MNRAAITTWTGSGKDGAGTLTCDSGALTNVPYSGRSRFVQEDTPTGANPEELLAAAHAASFTMALAERLAEAGHPPRMLRTEARCQVVRPNGGGTWGIPAVRLHCTATVPGLAPEALMRHASEARTSCPITQALRADITLTATLENPR